MDEEDSADELINKNAASGKGKRKAASLPSDEDQSEEDSEVSEEDATDSDEEEDEDEEVENSEDEGDGKEVEGAKAPLDAGGLSSDEEAEKCPICLNGFCDQPVATPENCAHYFCVDCILEWAKKVNSCPVDRIVFNNILLRKCFGGEVKKKIAVKAPANAAQLEEVDLFQEDTHCEACGASDREDRMLLCDGCDAGYHMECLTPPLNAVPVEEWFCPQCAPDSQQTIGAELSEEEISVHPTTSRTHSRLSRPGRAIARTQHSERVRANVNRHRIMQARTAAQVAPQTLTHSTWLDETINAVLARLNTDWYPELPSRPVSRRRRRTVRRRKTKNQGKATGNKVVKTKSRKRRVRRRKSRRKVVAKKETTTRGRIAQNLGLKKPVHGKSIPSVYRPYDQTLSSMRSEIGAASLSIYGDPADLSSSDGEQMGQAAGASSLLEAHCRGLSRSAMRSHQPVARPITAGLPSRHIPQLEQVSEAAAVPDLLGSILSGQTLLLMDSSDVIINRDGSLKPIKPVCLPSQRNSISVNAASDVASPTGAGLIPFNREPALSSPVRSSSTLLRPGPAPAPLAVPSSPNSHHVLPPVNGHPHFSKPLLLKPAPSLTSGTIDSRIGEMVNTTYQAPAKKPPTKPVWVDVAALPRIPKIKRESTSLTNGNSGSSNSLPDSSTTNLAGDKSRHHSVDQQRTGASNQDGSVNNQRQTHDKSRPSSSFSNSFSSSSSSSTSVQSNPPASSGSVFASSTSTISFRINSSGNPWHARKRSVPEAFLPTKDKNSEKKPQKDKRFLHLSQAKKTSVKPEVYDPFEPTVSDSSEDEPEDKKENFKMNCQSDRPVASNRRDTTEIKPETMELDSPEGDESPEMFMEVKEETVDDSPSVPLLHMDTPIKSERPNSAYGVDPVCSPESREIQKSTPVKSVAYSRSSSSDSYQSEQRVKVEVKTEPDLRPSPVEAMSPVESPVSKGNGGTPELSPLLGNSSNRQRSTGFGLMSPSRNPFSKDSASSSKKRKLSQSEESRHSHSTSPIHRKSHSRNDKHSYSTGMGNLQDLGCSQDRERSSSRDGEYPSSRDRESSPSRDRERLGSQDMEHLSSRDRERSSSWDRECPSSRDRESSPSQDRERLSSQDMEHLSSRDRECSSSWDRECPSSRDRESSPLRDRKRLGSQDRERSSSQDRESLPLRDRKRLSSQDRECPSSRDRESSPSRDRKRSSSQDRECPSSRDRESLPLRDRKRSSSRDMECPSSRDRESSPSRDRKRSSSRDRESSPSRDRESSPSRDRESSPSRDRKRLSSRDRESSPSRDRKRLSLRDRKRSSSRDRESSPSRDRERLSSRDRESSPLRDRERLSSRDRESSPLRDRERLSSRDRERLRSRGRESSPSRDKAGTGLRDKKHPRERKRSQDREHSRERKRSRERERKRSRDREYSRDKKRSQDREHARSRDWNLAHSQDREHSRKRERSKDREREFLRDRQQPRDKGLSRDKGLLRDRKRSRDKESWTDKGQAQDRECWQSQMCAPQSSSSESSRERIQEFSRPEQHEHRQKEQKKLSNEEILSRSRSKDRITEPLPPQMSSGSKNEDDEDAKRKPTFEEQLQMIKKSPQHEIKSPQTATFSSFTDTVPVDLGPSVFTPMESEPKTDGEYSGPSLKPKEENKDLPQGSCAIKEEPADSSDDDVNVEYLIDNLDDVKKEIKSEVDPETAGAAEPQPVVPEKTCVKQEPIIIMAGTKASSQGKRVTWNIEEPQISQQPEKMSKLALFKMKLKQEGSRRAASLASTHNVKDTASGNSASNPSTTRLNAEQLEDTSDVPQESTTQLESTDPPQKDKQYLKKLHMQERAVEEVKLAIKPFYQKKEITKEEYKEILRKAVQKVCHSKSGEINPVKVANLVKAYVDKYKYARKHHKEEELVKGSDHTE